MKVTHYKPEEWFDDLITDHELNEVWQKEVRVDLRKDPEQKESISFQMQLFGTYVRKTSDDEKLVIELDMPLGSTLDANEEDADLLFDAICDRAMDMGLNVRPGKIEFV